MSRSKIILQDVWPGPKLQAAKWLVFCYSFSIGPVGGGAPYNRRSGVAQCYYARCNDFESRRLPVSYPSCCTFHLLPARSVQLPAFFSAREEQSVEKSGLYPPGEQLEAGPGPGSRGLRKFC